MQLLPSSLRHTLNSSESPGHLLGFSPSQAERGRSTSLGTTFRDSRESLTEGTSKHPL